MTDGKICDVCGAGFELSGSTIRQPLSIKPTFRYKVWSVLPYNRDKVGYVSQDLCDTCRGNLEKALKMLKEREEQHE